MMRYKWIFLTVLSAMMVLTAGLASAGGPPIDPPGLERAIEAQEAHTDGLMAIDGVVGTAVGLTASGEAAVKIFTEAAGITGLPRSLDGVTVDVQVTGKFFALHHCKGKHADDPTCDPAPPPPGDEPSEPAPTDKWPKPVPIGVSTGNEESCSAGTIGARVTDGSNVYALSNNHVYALGNNASEGSNVLQPGRFDTNCAVDPNDVIGTLADFEPIIFSTLANNTIDAAIALSSIDDLDNKTPSDGYGLPTSVLVSEIVVGLAVQKYGRTTSLTKGLITGINATVNVGYSAGTARFVDQIIVQGNKPVIKAGDSGSLLVTDPDRNPVGLLFAGNRSGKLAVANRIDLVLAAFGVTIDGEE